MGIRKTQGKNKKSGRPAAAIAVNREEAVRKEALRKAAKPSRRRR